MKMKNYVWNLRVRGQNYIVFLYCIMLDNEFITFMISCQVKVPNKKKNNKESAPFHQS